MSEMAKKVDDYVGRQIRKRRNLLGLTQEQLAHTLTISYQQVQKYETGANRVSAGRLFEVAGRLGVDIGFFFEGAAKAQPVRNAEHGGKARSTVELVRGFDKIENREVRSALVGLIRELGRGPNAGHARRK